MTLDEDVATKLKAETKRTGRSFKDIVNETLRRGLFVKKNDRPLSRFRVEARDLGALRPGLNLDDIGELLEQIEGPAHR